MARMPSGSCSSRLGLLLAAQLDHEAIAATRKKFPWWRDRRPDLYGPLGAGR